MSRLIYSVTAGTLLFLGIIYGWQSARVVPTECVFEPIVDGVIASVRKVEGERIQYVVRAGNACQLLVFASRFPAYGVSEKVRLSGEAELTSDFPEELAGYGAYLRRRGIAGTMRFPRVERVGSGASPSLRESLRRRVEKVFPEPEASAVLAMVFGQVGTMPAATIQDFRVTGVSHILAISGMNLSLLTAVIWAISFLFPMPRAVRTLLVLTLMWAYVWLIAFPVSAVRAAWFWTFVLVALQLRRLLGLPAVFALAVLLMVSANPQIIWDIGFQLSLSAVAGMWLAAFLIGDKQPRLLPKWLWLTALATVGATLTTWPIVAYHFGIISLVSLLANLLIVPLVSAFMIISLLAIAIHFVVPPLALLMSFGVRLLWQYMTGVASTLARVPGAALAEISLPLWVLPIYYIVVIALALFWMQYQHRSWREMWE